MTNVCITTQQREEAITNRLWMDGKYENSFFSSIFALHTDSCVHIVKHKSLAKYAALYISMGNRVMFKKFASHGVLNFPNELRSLHTPKFVVN